MAGAKQIKGLCVATRCESVDQFVAMFQRFVDEDSFFIATKDVRPVGLETAFAIRLADKTDVLRGTCVVLQVWPTAANPFRHPGLRLGVKRLAASSMAVFERLLVTRKPRLTPELARTPGSELVLPANPLAEVSEVALEGFVDCTLYEESSTYFPAPEDEGESPADDEPIEPPAPSIVVDEVQLRAAEPPAIEPPPPLVEPKPPPRWDSSPLLVATTTVPPMPQRGHRRAIIACAAALGIVAIAVAVPFALAGTNDDEPATRVAIQTTPPAVVEPPPAPAPSPPPAAIAPACTIAVASTPNASTVLIDGKPAGATPLSVPATCERHKVDIAHVRYQPTTRWVTPTGDEPAKIELALARPTHQLAVTSSPPGATIIIDGAQAGTTPAVLTVQGFTMLKLALVRRGFHTTTARYYSKVPHDHLAVQMAK